MVKNISAFKDAGVHLQKWIAQKEKMMAVLGPISTEKEMNQNQVEQVKVSILLWIVVKWWIFCEVLLFFFCVYISTKNNSIVKSCFILFL